MPYAIYKVIHFLGIFVLLTALAASCMHVARGGTRSDNPYRKPIGAAHGLGAFLILLGGFGMLARLGVADDGLPGWIYLKLTIWVALGAALALAYRRTSLAKAFLIAAPLLAVAAGAIAIYKPLQP